MRMLIICLVLMSFKVFAGVVDLPDGCWKKSSNPCSIRATKSVWIKDKSAQFFLDKQSVLTRLEDQKYRLTQGQVWIETATKIEFQVFDKIKTVTGESWLIKNKEQFDLFVFSGVVTGTFYKSDEVILPGMQKWWQISTEGVMQAFEPMSTLKKWNQFVQLDKSKSVHKIAEYKKLWSETVQISSDFYQAILNRRVATEQSRVQMLEKAQRQKEAEKKSLRDLFRAKHFNP